MNAAITGPARIARIGAGVRFILICVAVLPFMMLPTGVMAASATFVYLHDAAGRLIAESSQGQGATTYACDPAGNLLQRAFSAEADADSDGLVTAAEMVLGLNPADPDNDDDGIDDGTEATAGTNPLDPLSRFQIASAVVAAGGAVEVTLATVAGRLYTLQSSADLVAWSDDDDSAAVDVAGTGLPLTLRDLNPAGPRRYYRVKVQR